MRTYYFLLHLAKLIFFQRERIGSVWVTTTGATGYGPSKCLPHRSREALCPTRHRSVGYFQEQLDQVSVLLNQRPKKH